jgi:hypothetical protein
MKNKVVRRLIEVEIKLGFLHIPASGIEMMPAENQQLPVTMPDGSASLRYNAQYKRLFGLTKWYKKQGVKVGDEVLIEKDGSNYSIKFPPKKQHSEPESEAETLIDLSGLSSQAKGDIVENRVKELIVLQGQGLLSVYRPVTDTHGIDLIVTKTGLFQPIFLQVKSRYNVQKHGYFLMDISKKTFDPHHSYYVLGAYFNPEKLEIDDLLLLVPSEEIAKLKPFETKIGPRYRVTNSLKVESQGKWAKYLIKKTDLASKLIEKFEEMGRYIK